MERLHQLIERLKVRWKRQAAIRELRQLSARQLCDIGIEPDRIEHVVDEIFKARREQAKSSAQAVSSTARRAPEARGGIVAVHAAERCC